MRSVKLPSVRPGAGLVVAELVPISYVWAYPAGPTTCCGRDPSAAADPAAQVLQIVMVRRCAGWSDYRPRQAVSGDRRRCDPMYGAYFAALGRLTHAGVVDSASFLTLCLTPCGPPAVWRGAGSRPAGGGGLPVCHLLFTVIQFHPIKTPAAAIQTAPGFLRLAQGDAVDLVPRSSTAGAWLRRHVP